MRNYRFRTTFNNVYFDEIDCQPHDVAIVFNMFFSMRLKEILVSYRPDVYRMHISSRKRHHYHSCRGRDALEIILVEAQDDAEDKRHGYDR